jgi:hypothetical protein
VVPHLTKDNWDRSGVLYWDKDDRVVYATVSQFVLRHEPGWQITRYVYQDGRLTHSSDDCFPKLDTARGALNLEAASSETVFGPIPEEEWPEDTQSPWIVFSVPRRTGS